MLARDWRGGELGVLVMALVLAVGVVSGISAFTSLNFKALWCKRVIGFWPLIQSSAVVRPLPEEWLQQAEEDDGLQQAVTLSFPSMVYAGEDNMYLACNQGGKRCISA